MSYTALIFIIIFAFIFTLFFSFFFSSDNPGLPISTTPTLDYISDQVQSLENYPGICTVTFVLDNFVHNETSTSKISLSFKQ